MKELYAALFAAQADFPPVKKDAKNPHFKSRYASLDGVKETIEPTLRKHELMIVQPPSGNGIGTGCTTILVHVPTGQELRETLLLPSAGPGKSADAQTGASAVTYSRRIGYLGILGISPSDDDDGNRAASGPQSGQLKANKKAAPAPAKDKATKAVKVDAEPDTPAGPQPPKAEIPEMENVPSVYPSTEEYEKFRTRAQLIKISLTTAGAKDAGKKLANLFMKKAGVESLEQLTKLQWEAMLSKFETTILKPADVKKAVAWIEEK